MRKLHARLCWCFNPFFPSRSQLHPSSSCSFSIPLRTRSSCGVVQAMQSASFRSPTHAHRWQGWCNRFLLHAYTTIRNRCHFCLASSHSSRRKNAFYVGFFGTADRKTHFAEKQLSLYALHTHFFRLLQLCYHRHGELNRKKGRSSRDIGDVALSLDQFKASWSASE